MGIIPNLIRWILLYCKVIYPVLPRLTLLIYNPRVFWDQFLPALAIDLLWIGLYSFLDVGKIRIVAADGTGTDRKMRFANIFRLDWKAWLNIALVRLIIGWVQLIYNSAGFFRSVDKVSSFTWTMTTVVYYVMSLVVGSLLILMPYFIVVERKGFARSVRESWRHTRDSLWPVLAVVVLTGLPAVLNAVLVDLIERLLLFGSQIPPGWIFDVLQKSRQVVTTVCYAFGWSVMGAIYAWFRARMKASETERRNTTWLIHLNRVKCRKSIRPTTGAKTTPRSTRSRQAPCGS